MNAKIRFAKMHGLGNDFVVIDGVTQEFQADKKLARKIAHRHFGIGCDQLLIVEPPINPEEDFYYRIFNANGNEVEQCGNGARCVGRFIIEEGLSATKEIILGYAAGRMKVIIESEDQVTALIGPPSFEPQHIPIKALRQNQPHKYLINVNQEMREVTALSLGNPHCIFNVPSIREARVAEIGKQLQRSPAFPEGVNVGFMQVLARNHIRLRIFERGVGETLACGTGAVAAVVAGIQNRDLSTQVKVDMRGGCVTVGWPHSKEPLFLTGSTKRSFDGFFAIRQVKSVG